MVRDRIDHDALTKSLLKMFFLPFIEHFMPNVFAELDPTSVEFVDKELIRGGKVKQRRIADLVARASVLGQPSTFLIHIEHQSSPDPDLPVRMYDYHCRLWLPKHETVYPVALLTYDKPTTLAADQLDLTGAGKRVVQFEYQTIQLNTLDWRMVLTQKLNPALTALMSKMRISPEDRPVAAAETLRMVSQQRLTDDEALEILGFSEVSLALTEEEERQSEQYLQALPAGEGEEAMIVKPKWYTEAYEKGQHEGKQEGRQEGRQEGERAGQVRMICGRLRRKFQSIAPNTLETLNRLPVEQLDRLDEAVDDFRTPSDLDTWLASVANG